MHTINEMICAMILTFTVPLQFHCELRVFPFSRFAMVDVNIIFVLHSQFAPNMQSFNHRLMLQ